MNNDIWALICSAITHSSYIISTYVIKS